MLKVSKLKSKNKSERIFERYLNSNGFRGKWTHEPQIPGKSKKLDYLLDHNGGKCFFEVKELRKKPNEPTGPAHSNPYSSLRSKIHKAKRQFKEHKEYSCSLVVYNIDDRTARLATLDPQFVFGAMLGDLGLTGEWDPDKGESVPGSVRNAFLDGGKMGMKKNTTISAVVVLDEFLDNIEIEKAQRKEEEKQGRKFTGPEWTAIRMKLSKEYLVRQVPRAVVVENPFARKPLPDGLFNGPFDERWRWTKENEMVERAFVGSDLRELEELKGKS